MVGRHKVDTAPKPSKTRPPVIGGLFLSGFQHPSRLPTRLLLKLEYPLRRLATDGEIE